MLHFVCMNDFLKMDIFFGVATLGSIIFIALVSIALFYVIRLLRSLSRLSEEVEEEAKALRADLNDARTAVKKEGIKLATLSGFFEKTGKRLMGRKRRKATKEQ